jgi:hypothetical protein
VTVELLGWIIAAVAAVVFLKMAWWDKRRPSVKVSGLCRVYYDDDQCSRDHARARAIDLAAVQAEVWPRYQEIYGATVKLNLGRIVPNLRRIVPNLERIVLDLGFSDPKHTAGIKMHGRVITINTSHGPWGDEGQYGYRHAFGAELLNHFCARAGVAISGDAAGVWKSL